MKLPPSLSPSILEFPRGRGRQSTLVLPDARVLLRRRSSRMKSHVQFRGFRGQLLRCSSCDRGEGEVAGGGVRRLSIVH